MEIHIILLVLFFHWIADFICQDEKWAINKANWFEFLIQHTLLYSFIMWAGLLLIFPTFSASILFFLITFVSHTLTDYFTSIVVKQRFMDKHLGSAIPNFGAYSIIGYDQLLHYTMLFYSLKYLL